ncbi:MAG TPA: hypothetical protein VF811_01240, partial [Parasulfuritortus sp.]
MVSDGSVALRFGLGWRPWDTGFGRGWPGGQLLSLLVQRKLTKESTPRFTALRVPNFSASVRAAAQLGLRPQAVLADDPRLRPEISAPAEGEGKTVGDAMGCEVVVGLHGRGFVFSPPS